MIVFDADTGAYKRHWGANGNKPDDSASRTTFGRDQGLEIIKVLNRFFGSLILLEITTHRIEQ